AQTIDWACADFNNDGLADHLFYERWAEGHDGPRLRILNGTGQGTIWEYPDFNSQHLFERMEGFTVMPANPIKDISGDEIPEVALVRILPDQPGAQLLIYDTSSNTELMRIILEEIDPDRKWEEWWHPGILVKEVGDYTSDGRDEVALVVLVGDTEVEKESKLVVVDVAEERTVVDFRAVGPEFVEIAQGRLGLVGLSGEAYFLDMTSDFSIASYAGNGTQGSPVTLSWTGITSGSISQIYVDDLQIAQTDGNQITIDISSGEHEVKIQSLDENGRGVWATEILNISKSPIPIILVFLITLILILIALSIALHINPIETIDWLRTKKRPAND
ncbi:MAG: hypothetical protein SVY53_04050, partial [Chloroflexota bacterium]|nr:hypothetical protein [Chloroflexota bacterium]